MAIRIEDGKGQGYQAAVTKDNKVLVYSTSETEAAYESGVNKTYFSWSNVSYDYDDGDTILLIKNDDTVNDLIINKIFINCSISTQAIIHSPGCASPTGTNVVGTNYNRTSGKIALATVKSNETTNSQGPILVNIFIEGGSSSKQYLTEGTIILGYGDCVAIDYATAGSGCYTTIEGYYHKRIV